MSKILSISVISRTEGFKVAPKHTQLLFWVIKRLVNDHSGSIIIICQIGLERLHISYTLMEVPIGYYTILWPYLQETNVIKPRHTHNKMTTGPMWRPLLLLWHPLLLPLANHSAPFDKPIRSATSSTGQCLTATNDKSYHSFLICYSIKNVTPTSHLFHPVAG
jgi:hypothetical protein